MIRTLGYAVYTGADIGECLETASAIHDGDMDSWSREWFQTSERIAAIGETCHECGRDISAREAWLRASNYYRAAEFFLVALFPDDPRAKKGSTAQPRDVRCGGYLGARAAAFEHRLAALILDPGFWSFADVVRGKTPELVLGLKGVPAEEAAMAIGYGVRGRRIDIALPVSDGTGSRQGREAQVASHLAC